jgi:hypothetical protein
MLNSPILKDAIIYSSPGYDYYVICIIREDKSVIYYNQENRNWVDSIFKATLYLKNYFENKFLEEAIAVWENEGGKSTNG